MVKNSKGQLLPKEQGVRKMPGPARQGPFWPGPTWKYLSKEVWEDARIHQKPKSSAKFIMMRQVWISRVQSQVRIVAELQTSITQHL